MEVKLFTEMTFSERLSAFLGHLGISAYAAEKAANVKSKVIYAAIKNNGEMGANAVGKILTTYPELNPDWLLSGQGEMLRSSHPPEGAVNERTAPYNPIPGDPVEKLGAYLKAIDWRVQELEQKVAKLEKPAEEIHHIKQYSKTTKHGH